MLLLLFCVIVYDIGGNRQYREPHIIIILLAFIFISGFSYRLGGDGIGYMKAYKQYGDITDLSFSYLMSFPGKQPGWVLLSTLCNTITNDYFLFKFIHAVILNTAYVKTIKKNAKFVFSALTVYFVLIFFNQNFEVLRESFAIAFFLFSLPFFYQNKWKKYYCFVLLAFLFHEGALFLVVLPLIKLFGFGKKTLILYIIAFVLFFLYASDILQYILTLSTSGEVENDKLWYYFHDIETEYEFNSLSNFVLNILFPVLVLFYYKRKNINIPYLIPAIVSLFIYLASTVLPMFYRFGNYVAIFNYLIITDFIFIYFMTRKATKVLKLSLIMLVFTVFVGFKARYYFERNYGETRYKIYVQYYPYASIFDKYEDPDREAMANELIH